jgi:quercetin dioxygenase-like cupin family protein
MSTLVKIACALNTNIASLMADGEAVDCVFIPAKHNGVEPTPTVNGYRILPLAVEFKQKKMQPFLFTVRSDELQDKANSHTGEEFIYVLEGGIEFRVREQTYTLRVGDSLFFNSIEEHFISKVLTTQAVYLNIFN